MRREQVIDVGVELIGHAAERLIYQNNGHEWKQPFKELPGLAENHEDEHRQYEQFVRSRKTGVVDKCGYR
jgi:hypothetical protein